MIKRCYVVPDFQDTLPTDVFEERITPAKLNTFTCNDTKPFQEKIRDPELAADDSRINSVLC